MSYTPGPFDSPHIYLQWGGKLPGNEQWSCGLRLAAVGGATLANDVAALASAVTAVTAYHQSINTGNSPRALLSFVKMNLVGTDGHYVEPVTYQTVVADLGGGGTVANTPANQIANAVSLTTGFSRGPAHRGRYYLPLPCFALDANGVYAAANAITVSNQTDTFIAALNAYSANAKVAVFSRKLGAPAHRLVTGNLVGRVYDTQRRRRRALVENYQ